VTDEGAAVDRLGRAGRGRELGFVRGLEMRDLDRHVVEIVEP